MPTCGRSANSRRHWRPTRQTYESFKEEFGEDYPAHVVCRRINLACSLRLVGDYSGARRLDQETLDRRRVVLSPDHPYTLDTAVQSGERHAGGGRVP